MSNLQKAWKALIIAKTAHKKAKSLYKKHLTEEAKEKENA